MQLPVLNSACELCELHTFTRNRCLPTQTPTGESIESLDSTKNTIVIVGQNPGLNEDLELRAFSPNGDSGRLVRSGILPHLPNPHNILLTNTARCFSPSSVTVKDKCYSACTKTYLIPELTWLSEHTLQLFVIALGSPAARHLANALKPPGASSKKITFNDLKKTQGVELPLPNGRTLHLYTTNHPAAALRNPNTLKTISVHLAQALRHMRGIRIARTVVTLVHPFNP